MPASVPGVSILGAIANPAQDEILSSAAQTFVATLHRWASTRLAECGGLDP